MFKLAPLLWASSTCLALLVLPRRSSTMRQSTNTDCQRLVMVQLDHCGDPKSLLDCLGKRGSKRTEGISVRFHARWGKLSAAALSFLGRSAALRQLVSVTLAKRPALFGSAKPGVGGEALSDQLCYKLGKDLSSRLLDQLMVRVSAGFGKVSHKGHASYGAPGAPMIHSAERAPGIARSETARADADRAA